MKDLTNVKVAIVHDWLVGGGAEKVVLELHRMFPNAPIYTSYATDEWRQKLDHKVVTGWLQRFGRLRKFMVLGRIWWFTRLDLSQYDLVITSSGNGEAFAVKTGPDTLHINYCHSPTHYYWRHYDSYMQNPGFGFFNPLARLGLRVLVSPLRKWDFKAAQRADVIIANSTHIQSDIQKYYRRDSHVVFPPVDTERFHQSMAVSQHSRAGFVTAGRLAPMKRVDVLIKAANKLSVPLTIIGKGPILNSLKKQAGPTVRFLGYVSDEELVKELSSAEAFLFASYEDFGIAPIEAMAAGTPVIAYQAGGALDYVIPGKTGAFFSEQTADSLIATLEQFNYTNYSSDDIKSHAQTFSSTNFHRTFLSLLQDIIK